MVSVRKLRLKQAVLFTLPIDVDLFLSVQENPTDRETVGRRRADA